MILLKRKLLIVFLSSKMVKNIDFICTSLSPLHNVSTFDAIVSAMTTIFSVPFNFLIVASIVKYPHMLYRSFYLIIANVALADLFAALFICPMSVSFHAKEAMNSTISRVEIQLLHSGFFITNGVSVLSMTLLSIDRLGILLDPFAYYAKLTRMRTIVLIVVTWLLSGALVSLYFGLGYIRFLFMFSTTTLLISMICMIATTILFKYRLRQIEKAQTMRKPSCSTPQIVDQRMNKRQETLNNFTQMDKAITSMFIKMLLLFLVNYVPAVGATLYMNFFYNRSPCTFVHITRDFIFLSILTSGLWRAVNFFACLRQLRDAAKTLLRCSRESQCEEIRFHGIVKL